MADPAYIVDGVLTDGEAWVGLATNDVTGTSTTIIAFESTADGSSTDWSQFMDLFIVGYASCIYAADSTLWLRYNLNDDATGANYLTQELVGDGSSVSASGLGATSVGWLPTNHLTAANVFGAYTTQFFDINSGKHKSSMWTTALDGNGSYERMGITTSIWQSQAPLTKIEIYEPNGFAFVAGSKFSLFGVLPSMLTTGTLP